MTDDEKDALMTALLQATWTWQFADAEAFVHRDYVLPTAHEDEAAARAVRNAAAKACLDAGLLTAAELWRHYSIDVEEWEDD